jgi:putative colanic acid biosynthesis acetyltransferase WcaF
LKARALPGADALAVRVGVAVFKPANGLGLANLDVVSTPALVETRSGNAGLDLSPWFQRREWLCTSCYPVRNRCQRRRVGYNLIQNLSSFRLPAGFRGRSAIAVQLWWLVQSTVFRWSPQFAYGFRRWLLRRFGANIGRGVLIRPTVSITYPWKLSIGDYAWVGDHVVLYTLGEIEIGANAVVSQQSHLCTGSHDYSRPDFPIYAQKITVEPEAWVATQVFVAPGVTIGQGAVIGARSSVFADMPAGMICIGSPCNPVNKRSTGSEE